MEPTKQVDADPSGLDDPGQPRDGSSSRQPPRWPLLEQEQEPAMAPLMHMPLVERATPPPPNSPQLLQPQGHDVVGGSSTLAGFRSNYDIWGLDIAGAPVARPMFHPDSRWPSTPNFINNQFSGAAAPFSASGHYTSLSPHAFVPLTAPFANQPAPSFNQQPSASHWASMPSSSSANGPQPGAATAFFPRGHNASLDPYAFPRLAAPLANQADGSQLLSSPQAICFLTDEQFRARLFGCPRLPSLVMSREISARRVVLMLHEGDDRDLRLWVLDAILRNVHMVMGSRAGSAVFLALLRAVLPQELCCIVQAASSPPLDRTSLMGVANRKPGEIALKELFWAVAQIPQLCWPLFNCLVNGWIMEQSNGPELLRHFFTTLDYYYCRIFIRHLALPGFAGMVTSEFGWRCMLICLDNARDDGTYTELPDLEQAILSGTVDIAKTKYGNCFLQEVLKSGRYIQLQECIRERVERNLEGLSAHHFGNYMVQACYVPLAREPELPLLRRGLEAFFALRDGPLYEVVHDRYASRLLCKLLLLTAEKDMETASPWKRTVALAQRIQGMLRASQDETSRQVMQVVEKVISAAQRRR